MSHPDFADTRLGGACAPAVDAHPGRSGFVPLVDGHDAFAARVALADAAERTLDARYYIWRNDLSGRLLFAALHRAAERGVRVRLLLDDNNTSGLDEVLAALDGHPNIEVRLFNPFKHRRWRLLQLATGFLRLNRRMHNKSFTADERATIVGGRNVGDEYFDVARGPAFVDLDVLAIGQVVRDVSSDFQRYWTSAAAVPVGRLLPRTTRGALDDVAAAARRLERDPGAVAYVEAVRKTPFVRDLLMRRLEFDWAEARLLSDEPTDPARLWPRLEDAFHATTRELYLVSPYFVPGRVGVDALAALVERGVQVTVLTNSLEATDVAVVHSGYAKRRRALLRAGVKLFELKRISPLQAATRLGTRGSLASASSASSLHAKIFVLDRTNVFIGSFNLDPRSARLNTEMGIVIERSAFASVMAGRLAEEVPTHGYAVRLDERGRLVWIERRDGDEIVHAREPGIDLRRRIGLWVLSLLPIEWLL